MIAPDGIVLHNTSFALGQLEVMQDSQGTGTCIAKEQKKGSQTWDYDKTQPDQCTQACNSPNTLEYNVAMIVRLA